MATTEQRRTLRENRVPWNEAEGTIDYSFEAPRRLRAAFVGCGGHSYRNVYPTFRFAPVNLVAVADVVEDRAHAYRKEFGAERAYTDYKEMFEKEDLDCVFVVTNYDENGEPRFAQIAIDAMNAGIHAWIEKPPASSLTDVERMIDTSRSTGKYVQVGYKKMFVPSYEKAREIIERPEFGGLTQLSIRYPQSFPPPDTRYDLANTSLAISVLDHVCHPLAILQQLGGDAANMTYWFEGRSGGVVAVFEMRNGAIATWHSTGSHAGRAPLERVEAVGKGAEIFIDNTVRLTYYPPTPNHYYGRVGDFYREDAGAALHWEPEFSLGVLYNDKLFFLGYAPEVRAFCQSILTDTSPAKAGLRDTWMQVQIYEAFKQPAGTTIDLAVPPI